MIDLENVSKSYDKGQPAVSHATLHPAHVRHDHHAVKGRTH